jgi:hypothetical protein
LETFASPKAGKIWNKRFAGKKAFTAKLRDGYHHGSVLSIIYRAHRVAWAIHFGAWPALEIDHINGDRADNRISNLRDVSHAENMKNRRKAKWNTSGHTGIDFHARRWRARCTVGGKTCHIGFFEELDDAIKAREMFLRQNGFDVNHGQ